MPSHDRTAPDPRQPPDRLPPPAAAAAVARLPDTCPLPLLQFLANLRARGSVEVDDTLEQEIVQHFESLPSRCAACQPARKPARCLLAGAGAWLARPVRPPPRCPPPPCRYALDVNISSLDVLNHKRLLDSARADPSAVSFQLRPVDVVSGSDLAKRPSFGSLDTLQLQSAEVRRSRAQQGCG